MTNPSVFPDATDLHGAVAERAAEVDFGVAHGRKKTPGENTL